MIVSHKQNAWIIDSCCIQILWIIKTLNDYEIRFRNIPIMCDNTSAKMIFKMWFLTLELKTHIYRHQKPNCQYFHEILELLSLMNCELVKGLNAKMLIA